MKKITLALLFICSIVYSQETITTVLGDFNDVKVFSGLTVNLIKSDAVKIVITGNKADQVSVKNKNGLLKLSLKFTDGFKADDININLYYSKILGTLDANEGAYILSNDIIEQLNLELKVQEGAHIELPLNVKYITAKAVSGGVIDINGTTQSQIVDVSSAGVYKAYDLISKQTTATASSGGIIQVQASELLNANVNLGGSIYYSELPQELITKKVVGGTIKQKE
jgi:hypothetical protein